MIALLLSAIALGDEIEVDSRVEAVTVFDGQARVTRVATARVPAGRSDLVFDGLPLSLRSESLSASGQGAATLLGVDVRTVRGSRDRDDTVASLREDKRGLQDAIAAHRDTIARVEADLRFIAALTPTGPAQLDRDLFLAADAPRQLATLSRDIGADTRRLLTEKRTAERAIRDLEKEVARIDREIARIGSETRDANRVAVGIDARTAGAVTVRVSYLVDRARWTPRYDARYDLSADRVRLDLSGVVTQSTGEAWEGATLTLSTAAATRGTAPPELTPFTLRVGGGGVRAPASSGERGLAYEFQARRPVDVPSDGSERQVPLASVTLEAETVHRTVPRASPVAYLTAKVVNTADWAWLPGPVNSYLGSAFVGRGALPATGPGGEAAISFGVDDRVAVQRVRVEDISLGSRPLSNRQRQAWGFETRVTNGTPSPIDLVVVEQVPTTRDARYEVEVKVVPEAEIPKEGIFEWSATVSPGAEATFLLEYEVSWPEGERPLLLD